MQEGAIRESTAFTCKDGYDYENEKKVGCHLHKSPLNLRSAIEISCNAYFCNTFEKYFRGFDNSILAYDNWFSHLNLFEIINI